MSQMPSNAPIMESRPGPGGWLPVWIKAVTQPNEQTFVDITESPDATSKTAFIWVFIAGTLSYLVSGLISSLLLAAGIVQSPSAQQLSQDGADFMRFAIGGSMIATICFSPLSGLFSVIGFAISVAILQWVAKLFGGTGTFDKMAYAIAAISMPFSLVTMFITPLSSIPFVNYCSITLLVILLIYVLVLQVMAVKGVNRFGWGSALGAVFLPSIVIVFFCGCLVLGGLMLTGADIGDVYSEINQSLQNAP
jgi:hypothetical protein